MRTKTALRSRDLFKTHVGLFQCAWTAIRVVKSTKECKQSGHQLPSIPVFISAEGSKHSELLSGLEVEGKVMHERNTPETPFRKKPVGPADRVVGHLEGARQGDAIKANANALARRRVKVGGASLCLRPRSFPPRRYYVLRGNRPSPLLLLNGQ